MSRNTKLGVVVGCFLLFILLIFCSALAIWILRVSFMGSGRVVTEKRAVTSFNSILLQGTGEVIVTQGEEESLEVKAEDNIISKISTEVQNNTLVLSIENSPFITYFPTKPIVYNLTVKDLSSITVAGSGKAYSDRLKSKDLKLSIAGSGDIELDIFSSKVTSTITGSGNIILIGNTENQEVTVNGSGNYRAEELRGKSCSIEINGSGNAFVNCRIKLDVEINGSGGVIYAGDPEVTEKIFGSGKVRKE